MAPKRKASSKKKPIEEEEYQSDDAASHTSEEINPSTPITRGKGFARRTKPKARADQLQTQAPSEEDEYEHPVVVTPQSKKKKPNQDQSDSDASSESSGHEEDAQEVEDDGSDSTARKRIKATPRTPRTSSKKKYVKTPTSYRITEKSDGSTSIIEPPSKSTRSKNYSDYERAVMFKLVYDIYDHDVPASVHPDVWELLSKILAGREGQADGIRKHYYRSAKHNVTENQMEELKEDIDRLLELHADDIFEVKDKVLTIQHEARLKRLDKMEADRRKMDEQVQDRRKNNARRISLSAELTLNGENPNLDADENLVASPPGLRRHSTGQIDSMVSSFPTPSPQMETSTSQSSQPEKDSDTVYAEKLITDLIQYTGKSKEMVGHALFACSGNANLAAKLLDDKIELTEEEKKLIWTHHDDSELSKKSKKARKYIIEKKGKSEVEKRIAWLESSNYEDIEDN